MADHEATTIDDQSADPATAPPAAAREPAEGSPDVPASDGGAHQPEASAAAPASTPAASPAPAGGMSPLDVALGVVRLGVGAALVVAPGWAGRVWVGPGADGPGSKVFARALGARDVALGVQILRGAQRGEPVRHWVMAGFVADAADVTAAMIAARHLTPARRLAMPLIAGLVGAGGVMSWRSSGGA